MRKSHRLFRTGLVLLVIALGTLALGTGSAFADPPQTHVVCFGETLYSIATAHDTTVHAILQANDLRNPDLVFVGQRLVIPGGSMPGPLKSAFYVVQQNDTLFSVATRSGTTVSALMQVNNLYNYMIFVGQVLKVPGYAAPLPVAMGQPRPQSMYHIVRQGDYLSSIANRYHSSPYSIQIANKLPNQSFLWPGQKLYIPDGPLPGNQQTGFAPLPSIYNPLGDQSPLVPQPNSIAPPYAGQVPIVGQPPYSGQQHYAGQPPIVGQPPYAGQQPFAGQPPYDGQFPIVGQQNPIAPPIVGVPAAAPYFPNPYANGWEAILGPSNHDSGSCSLAVTVVGKTDWPVVVATPDGSWISDPKYTGTKPERGPYVVEFAHSCTGTWRVIPLGLNISADVAMNGGHVEVEFHPRLY